MVAQGYGEAVGASGRGETWAVQETGGLGHPQHVSESQCGLLGYKLGNYLNLRNFIGTSKFIKEITARIENLLVRKLQLPIRKRCDIERALIIHVHAEIEF